MAFASLVDAGADLDRVLAGLGELPVTGWSISASKVRRQGLVGTYLRVDVGPEEGGEGRHWGAIRRLLEAADALPERAVQRAQAVFARLAAAEGRLHGVAPEEVHFHEVGSTDAILDVVGTCLALEDLDVAHICASPVTVGLGTVTSAHGVLPNPAPAVLELLQGVPVRGVDQGLELTTPTGAALLSALAEGFGPLPAIRVKATGYGAGTRDVPGTPNVAQVIIGQLTVPGDEVARPGPEAAVGVQDLVVLEANVDDATGEVLAHTVSALLAAGAFDAWLVPVLGKKGRPAQVLCALADPSSAAYLGDLIARHTGVLGWRQHPVKRSALPRNVVTVEVDGQPISVKTGPYRAKAEYDDCAAAAAALGMALVEVARRAERLASEAQAPIA